MGQLIECHDELAPGCLQGVSHAVTSVDGYSRREQGLLVRGNDPDALHNVVDACRVVLADLLLNVLRDWKPAGKDGMRSVVVGLFTPRLEVGPARGKRRAGVLGLEPIDHAFDPLDLLRQNVVALAQRRRHVDMGNVVARRRLDTIERLEEQPMPTKIYGAGGKVCVGRPGETVAQMPVPVAGVGEIAAGLALETRTAARDALAREADGQQRIAHGSTFAHRAAAAARTLEITRG